MISLGLKLILLHVREGGSISQTAYNMVAHGMAQSIKTISLEVIRTALIRTCALPSINVDSQSLLSAAH